MYDFNIKKIGQAFHYYKYVLKRRIIEKVTRIQISSLLCRLSWAKLSFPYAKGKSIIYVHAK